MKTKILIIKIGAIGDVVMASPMLNKLKNDQNQCVIHWLCGRKVEKLLKATQLVDKLSTLNEDALLNGSFFHKLFQLFRAWKHIGFRRYHQVIIAHSDWRYSLLSLFTLRKKRITMSNMERKCPLPGRYHSYEYCRLLGNYTDYDFPKLHIEPSKNVQQIVATLKKPLVVMAPGGNPLTEPGKNLRMWPMASYLKFAQAMEKEECQVAVVGGPSDDWLHAKMAHTSILNLVGKFSLLDLIYFFQHCACVVTHDSGPMHLALIAQTNVLGLFGPTNPHEKLPTHHPRFKQRARFIWGGEGLNCRPCYDGKSYAPCQNPICMKSISIEKAVTICKEWLYG